MKIAVLLIHWYNNSCILCELQYSPFQFLLVYWQLLFYIHGSPSVAWLGSDKWYDLYQKLQLQFDVLLMMGAIDTRNT
jgi:hypothetical protein